MIVGDPLHTTLVTFSQLFPSAAGYRGQQAMSSAVGSRLGWLFCDNLHLFILPEVSLGKIQSLHMTCLPRCKEALQTSLQSGL